MTDPFLLVRRENSTNLCYFPCMLFVILVADMLVRPYLQCSSQYMLYSVCTTDSNNESSKIGLPQLGLCNKNLYFTEFIFIYHAFLYTAQTWESRQVEVGIKAFFIVNFMLYWHLVVKCRWTKSTKNTSWPTVTRNSRSSAPETWLQYFWGCYPDSLCFYVTGVFFCEMCLDLI